MCHKLFHKHKTWLSVNERCGIFPSIEIQLVNSTSWSEFTISKFHKNKVREPFLQKFSNNLLRKSGKFHDIKFSMNVILICNSWPALQLISLKMIVMPKVFLVILTMPVNLRNGNKKMKMQNLNLSFQVIV